MARNEIVYLERLRAAKDSHRYIISLLSLPLLRGLELVEVIISSALLLHARLNAAELLVC